VVSVATEAFAPLARIEMKAWGWEVPLARIQHPLGGIPLDQVASRADAVVEFFLAQTTGEGATAAVEVPQIPQDPMLRAPADVVAFLDFVAARGLGDGLPVVPPTPARVEAMLRSCGADPEQVVGRFPPRRLLATVRDVAVNAVLAGCPEPGFPVVLAALRAALAEEFNLLGVLATTHPCGITVIVSGPAARSLGLNSGLSLYGPGSRLNAGIGRAVRLALQNLGGAWPGSVDKSTQGSPAKYTYCFAENLEASPWGPYHVERGFDASATTVTVASGEGPHNVHDPASRTAESLLRYLCTSMAHSGHNGIYHKGDLFLVLCPEHAELLASAGYDRRRIREHIFETARVPGKNLGRDCYEHFTGRWPEDEPRPADMETSLLALTRGPDQIHVLVAGGAGKHSSWIPTFGLSYSATVPLERR